MVAVVLPLEETDQSVRRPVAMSVLTQLIKYLQFPSGISIVYPAELERMPQPGSSIQDVSRAAYLEPRTRISIELNERYGSSFIGSDPISRTQMKPVFQDKLLDVSIKPAYTKAKLEFTIKYSDVSRNAILRWRNQIRMRLSTVFDTLLHSLDYHYPIPETYLNLLHLIYQYRENQGGYGDSFQKYISEWSSDRITQISTLIGTEPLIAIREKQIRVLGLIEFEPLLEMPEKDQEGSLWCITFTYKVNYMKPIGCVMNFPLMIHNQLLPEDYVVPSLDTQVDRILPETASQLITGLREFEIYRLADNHRNALSYTKSNNTLKLPYWDDWYPLNVPTATFGLIDILCMITPDDTQSLFNLKQLDILTINKHILNYFETEYPYLTQIYKSFYHLELYQDNNLLKDQYLVVDENLNVSSNVPLDIRKRYHVRLSIIKDIGYIYRAAFDRLRLHPNALVETIKALISDSNLDNSWADLDNLKSAEAVSIFDMYRIYRRLTGKDDFLTPSEVYSINKISAYGYLTNKTWDMLKKDSVQMNTVMVSQIVAVEPNSTGNISPVRFRA